MSEFNLKNAVSAATFIFLAVVLICGQDANLQMILERAEAQTKNYRESFKNLASVEVKTFEIFDKNGALEKQGVVESNFIIYQSAKDEKASAEFRNVFRVDGKAVGDSEKRTVNLFERIARAGSPREELEKIKKESQRYDLNLRVNGITLYQSPILADYARPFFDFSLTGRENLNDSEVFLVEYCQTQPSPYVLINQESVDKDKLNLIYRLELPPKLSKSSIFLRGRLWIDAQTFRIWREERELTARVGNAPNPVLLFKNEFEYQPSDFGILVPKKISFSSFEIKMKDERREISSRLRTRARFEYAKFSQPDVEVKPAETNLPKN